MSGQSGYPKEHLGFRGLGFRVRALGFRVRGLGFRVRGLGFSGPPYMGSCN